MKLRFDHQSIRLRLRKSDVEKLTQERFIVETVQFPTGSLVYRLELSDAAETILAMIRENTITVSLPAQQAMAWAETETVGIYATFAIDQENSLDLIIEKDFPCKHDSKEENADTFEELSKKTQFP
jgi:hypothetical protein